MKSLALGLMALTSLFSVVAQAATPVDCASVEAYERNYYVRQAIGAGNIDRLRQLLDDGACVDGPSGSVSVAPPIVEAAYSRGEAIARLLLERGAKVDKPMFIGADNTATALQVATDRGASFSFIELLVNAGANLNAGSMKMTYRNPLANGLRNGDEAVLDLLISKGAKPAGDELLAISNPFLSTDRATTPGAVAKLIGAGANVNAAVPWLGNTPLHIARNPEIIRMLVKAGAKLDAQNRFGDTPVMGAVTSIYGTPAKDNTCESARAFLELGADFNATNKFGQNALLYWLSSGQIGGQPDQLYDGTACAIRVALEFLPGLNVNLAEEETGLTPIMYAANWYNLWSHDSDRRKILELLLQRGADLKAKDKQGRTALDLVRNEEIRKILKGGS
jgi:ankyrin repeat protein